MSNEKESVSVDTDADSYFMNQAIDEARIASEMGEVPVGAVIVKDGKVIGRGRNTRETGKTALGHAEIMAIEQACAELGGWRLMGCTLYVTMEPCSMCAGAIISARIPKVICAVKDAKAGAFGSVLNVNSYPLNHKTDISFGLMENKSRELIGEFFEKLRKKRKGI